VTPHHEKAPHEGGASPHPVAFIGCGDVAQRCEPRRDAIYGLIREKGLIPRFRYASSKILRTRLILVHLDNSKFSFL
jgi:hypothetical protein